VAIGELCAEPIAERMMLVVDRLMNPVVFRKTGEKVEDNVKGFIFGKRISALLSSRITFRGNQIRSTMAEIRDSPHK
jgi:hypothetical protein